MTALAIPQAYLNTLRELDRRLRGAGITWAITGSLGFALQGVPVAPRDIDLQTDAAGAYAVERLLVEHVVRPVAFSEAAGIRSHFGALEVAGIAVEIMGDIEKRLPDGTWGPPVDLPRHRRLAQIDGMRIPVLDLDYERQAYRALGRVERARMLEEWLHGSGCSIGPAPDDGRGET